MGNSSSSPDRATQLLYYTFSILVFAYLLSLTHFSGTSKYSPDSWSYYELAQTFFSDAFYKFNTYRNYFSNDRSASFPLGYPAVLFAVNEIAGWEPINAAYLNALLAFCSFLLVQKAALRIGLSRLAGLSLASGFIFYPGFLDEVVSGRSIPAAATVTLAGICVTLGPHSIWRMLAGGLLFGAASLIRFDFLLSAWAAMMLLLWFEKRGLAAILSANLGFLLGMMPWIIYSMIFFSKVWVSDNSWVALSTRRAYVLDFPAHANETLFTDPIAWLNRILHNTKRVIFLLPKYALNQPLLLMLFIYVSLASVKGRLNTNKSNILVALAGIMLAIIPYILTDYTDSRYFAFLFFGATTLLLILTKELSSHTFEPPIYLSALIIMLIMSVKPLAESYKTTINNHKRFEAEQTLIDIFRLCQNKEPDTTYIFYGPARRILFKYGALTGHKTASLPTNYSILDENTRIKFFNTFNQYRLINSLTPPDCSNLNSLKSEKED